MALEGSRDGCRVARGVHQDARDGVTEEATEVDAGEHHEGGERIECEGHRQQQCDGHRRAHAGQHADSGADHGPDQDEQEGLEGQDVAEAAK